MKFKRVLAGLLVGAMVVTSAPVSGLGALAVLAAENETELTYEAVDDAILEKNATANSEQYPVEWTNDGPAEWAFDGNSGHWWHSRYDDWDQLGSQDANDVITEEQKEIMFTEGGPTVWIGSGFDGEINLGKITYMGRSDKGDNWIGNYKLYVADVTEGTPTDDDFRVVATGTFTNSGTQEIVLEEPVKATHFRLEALSIADGNAGDTHVVSATEIKVYSVKDAEVTPPSDERVSITAPTLSVTAPAENTAPADTVAAGYVQEVFADASAAPAALTTENLVVEKDGDYQAFSGKVTAASSEEANAKFNVTEKTPFLIRFMMKTDALGSGDRSLIGKMDDQFGVQINPSYITFFCHDGATNGWPQIQKSLSDDFWGQWHEVVAMYNGDSLKLYVDGTQASEGERANSGVTLGEYANTQFTLGYNSTKSEAASPAYTGKYADVVMYTGDEVPTDAEDYTALIAALAEKTSMFDLNVQAGEGEAPNYTMTTAWTDASGAAVETFEKDRLYTMTATLTANENYKFTEESKPATVKVGEDDVKVTAEVSEDGSTMTISCVFGNEPGIIAQEALAAAKAAAEKVLAADKYTEDSYAVFATAKEAADNLAEDASPEEVQKAADDLMAAIQGLVMLFTEVSAPAVSFTAPVAGEYTETAQIADGDSESVHYTEIADRAANPVALTKYNADSTAVIENVAGIWGFNDPLHSESATDKFDVYGDTPLALNFKMYVKEKVADGNTVNVLGKMDAQYGFQIENKNGIERVLSYYGTNGGWPEQQYIIDEEFYGKWHDIVLLFDGEGNMKFYVDGNESEGSEGRPTGLTLQHNSNPFTLFYNPEKDDITMFTSDIGYLADVKAYSGDGAVDSVDYSYAVVKNTLDAAEPLANITLTPYDAKTTWYAGETAVAKNAKFAGETVYTVKTVFTAHEGYGFTENSKPSVDGAAVEITDGGMTMTVTKTFPSTAEITCTCVLGEITGVADQTVALGTADSKTVTLRPSAAVNGDCKIDGHPQNVAYTYEVIGAGTTGATVSDEGIVTVTDAGNATVKITATLTKDDGEILTAEKSIVLTVTSNKATAEEKEDLQKVIDDAKTVDGNLYTEATFTTLSNAIKTAETVYNKANASKTEVANAQKALEDAKRNLKTKEQELKEQIAKAKDDLYEVCKTIEELKVSDYTVASYNALVEVYNRAAEVYRNESATLEQVNAAIAELNDAKAALVLQETAALEQVKADIAKALASADAVLAAGKKDNTDAQWNAFVNAYNAVKNAPEDADSATLRGLLSTLTAAQGALKADVVLAAPTIKTAKAAVYKSGIGVKITVNAVAGASKYDVYRVVKNKATKVGTTQAGKTTITDKKVTSKTVSYYAVAVSADGKVVSKAGAAKKVTLAKAPTAKKVTRTSKGVKITWKKVKGATKYVIYRSTKSSSGYAKIGTAKKSATSFVSKKKVTKGKTYYYKVVAVKKSTVSLMSKAKKIKIKK